MRIKTAMTVLNKRAKYYGQTFDELIEWLDNRYSYKNEMGYVDESIKVLEAYEVYKMDQGYTWSGVNYETWVKA
jgi:hypothetical protein